MGRKESNQTNKKLIGASDNSSKGAYEEVILTSSHIYVKIGLREINIGSTHTFWTHYIKNPAELR